MVFCFRKVERKAKGGGRMKTNFVAGVLIDKKGLIAVHIPYRVVKHKNKEFWLTVAGMLEELAIRIREDVWGD